MKDTGHKLNSEYITNQNHKASKAKKAIFPTCMRIYSLCEIVGKFAYWPRLK